ncbi:hypothetical protein M8J75_006595 [Diaphorina citri]|nr:hypothetical protein M8J75_006595 [Diaphorina citri]KAI5739754.1 hypothetical protein M8J77_023071 [Diaphorina citri]
MNIGKKSAETAGRNDETKLKTEVNKMEFDTKQPLPPLSPYECTGTGADFLFIQAIFGVLGGHVLVFGSSVTPHTHLFKVLLRVTKLPALRSKPHETVM